MSIFAVYEGEIQIRSRMMGATPKDPGIIIAWLKKKTGLSNTILLQEMMLKTLIELGAKLPENPTLDEIDAAAAKLSNRQAVGFKRDENGLYLESRCLKANLKEAAGILFLLAEEWKNQNIKGVTKTAKHSMAEWAYVDPEKLYLGTDEPDGIDLCLTHIVEWNGKRHDSMSYYEYVDRPLLSFQVKVVQDRIKPIHWEQFQELSCEDGLGGRRSQGFGRYDWVKWQRVS